MLARPVLITLGTWGRAALPAGMEDNDSPFVVACATAPSSVAGNGQELCTHEDALTQVAHCGPCRFGQSEIYSARPVTDSFEQAHMHTVPTT